MWSVSFDTYLSIASFSSHRSIQELAVFHLRALVAISHFDDSAFFTRGDNLIVASACASLVRPEGPIAEWNGRPT